MPSKFYRQLREKQAQEKALEDAKANYPAVPVSVGVEAFINDWLATSGSEHMMDFEMISLDQRIHGNQITSFTARIKKGGKTATVIYPPKT